MRSYKSPSRGLGDYSTSSLPRHSSHLKSTYTPSTRYTSNYSTTLGSSPYKSPLDFSSPTRSHSYASGLSSQKGSSAYHPSHETSYRGSSVHPSYPPAGTYSSSSKSYGSSNYSNPKKEEASASRRHYGSITEAHSDITSFRAYNNPRKSSYELSRGENLYAGVLKGERKSIDLGQAEVSDSVKISDSVKNAQNGIESTSSPTINDESTDFDTLYRKYVTNESHNCDEKKSAENSKGDDLRSEREKSHETTNEKDFMKDIKSSETTASESGCSAEEVLSEISDDDKNAKFTTKSESNEKEDVEPDQVDGVSVESIEEMQNFRSNLDKFSEKSDDNSRYAPDPNLCLNVSSPWADFDTSFDAGDDLPLENNAESSAGNSKPLWNDFDQQILADEMNEKKKEKVCCDMKIDTDTENSGSASENEQKNKTSIGMNSFLNLAAPPSVWEQFCSFDEGTDYEPEEHAQSEPPWEQFCLDPSNFKRRFSIQVEAETESESEDLSENVTTHRHPSKPANLAISKLLQLPATDSAIESSASEYESEAESQIRLPKTFSFLPKNVDEEERGRVQEHLAIPAPIFNIKVTYCDSDMPDEESVASVSDYEDISEGSMSENEADEEEACDYATTVPKLMVTSMDTSIMAMSDYQEQPSLYESAYDADVSRPVSNVSNDENAMYKSVDDIKQGADHKTISTDDVSQISEIFVDAPTLANVSHIDHIEESSKAMLSPQIISAAVTEMPEVNDSCDVTYPLLSAQIHDENLPGEKAERFSTHGRRPTLESAMVRTAKGVNEQVKHEHVVVRVAPAHQEISDSEVTDLPDLTYESQVPQNHAADEKVTSIEVTPTYVKQQHEQVDYDRADRYQSRKPSGDWAKKSLIQPLKKEKIQVSVPKVLTDSRETRKIAQETAPMSKYAKYKAESKQKVEPTPQPTGPSFEEQMEELRRKIKCGSSNLNQQMKDLSKGISDATINSKMTAEQANYKDLVKDTTQLRDAVNKKLDKWKEDQEVEKTRRQKDIEAVAEKQIQKAKLAMAAKVTAPFIEPQRQILQERKPSVSLITNEIEPNQSEGIKNKVAMPKTSAFSGRQPSKISSPFVAKDQEIRQAPVSPRSEISVASDTSAAKQLPVKSNKSEKTEQKPLIEVESSKTLQSNLKSLERGPLKTTAVPPLKSFMGAPEMTTFATSTCTPSQLSQPAVATSQVRQPEKQQAELQKNLLQKADLIEPVHAPMGKTRGTLHKTSIEPTKLHSGSIEATLVNKPFLTKASENDSARPKFTKMAEDVKPKSKKCFKCKHRNNKFIGEIQDIDELLAGKENRKRTFDQLEMFYQNCSTDQRKNQKIFHKMSTKRNKQTKIYIWDVTNVDDLYSARDLQAILAPSSPTTKSANFSIFKPGEIQSALNKKPTRGLLYSLSLDKAVGDLIPVIHLALKPPQKVDDCALQIYKSYDNGQSDYGSYLDSDMSLSEQPDELTSLKEGKKTSLVLRTQLSVRVQAIKDKLKNSKGKDLRRALFSLKQIFQDDKDLVHEFVQNDGLSCLIRVNVEADQTYQNYILRALGQVMLYVDGMNGVIAHNETIQWLYGLLGSPFRLVAKTALKLLLVFVEYTESNSLLLLAAVYIVDKDRNSQPWAYLMQILNDKENNDVEMFVYAMSLVNKTLGGIPDQGTYYDVVDALEEQGMEETLKRLTRFQSKDLADLCRTYEKMLNEEDSDGEEYANLTVARMRHPTRSRNMSADRKSVRKQQAAIEKTAKDDSHVPQLQSQARRQSVKDSTNKFVPPKKVSQAEEISTKRAKNKFESNSPEQNSIEDRESSPPRRAPLEIPYKKHSIESEQIHAEEQNQYNTKCPPPKLPDLTIDAESPVSAGPSSSPGRKSSVLSPHRPSLGAVHALAEKMNTQNIEATKNVPTPSVAKNEDSGQPASFADALSKARRGMDKKLASQQPVDSRKESEIQWEKAMENLNRPLIINNLDFTELEDTDDCDPLRMAPRAAGPAAFPGGIPAPPAFSNGLPAPPPFPAGALPPPPFAGLQAPPALSRSQSPNPAVMNKDMRTVKLFWKEAQLQPQSNALENKGVFWQNVKPVDIDTDKVVQLFETKTTKDVAVKKKEEKKQQLLVLDTKRSNAINIGLTKLPPARAIKTAILKFDSSILNKECIEKILSTMMPTEEEKERILNAQLESPDVPLGSAEQFLLLMSEIPVLFPRLKLWLFMLDYANIEKEVADPLMDLKLAMEELEQSRTFKYVMGTLLAVGNVLNGAEIKGFQLDFLAKVPEIKDTVNKHSLVHHLCSIVMEKFPDSTDLYSELGAAVRCARMDFEEVAQNLDKMERDCKASWDYVRMLVKQESSPHNLNKKIGEFLSDCAQRIMTLKVIHRRVWNRFRKFLLYMGIPQHAVKDTKVNATCRTITEFALEYRACREKINQQKKRQLDKRERNKTRGKLITGESAPVGANVQKISLGSPKVPNQHEELSKVLSTSSTQEGDGWMSYPGVKLRHRRDASPSGFQGHNTNTEVQESADDEIIDGLVKAATVKSDVPREKRRARQFNRKSLRRTRTLKLGQDQGSDDH